MNTDSPLLSASHRSLGVSLFPQHLLRHIPLLIVVLCLGIWGGCRSQTAESSERHSLAAEQETVLQFQAETPVVIGWRLPDDSESMGKSKECPERFCIALEQKNGTGAIKAQHGGAVSFEPKDGKIELALRNLAPFPLEVEVYRK